MKISVHPLFIILGILCIYFGSGLLFISYALSIFLHELGHAYVAKKLGYTLKNISFLPFGVELNLSQKFYKNHEILIAIAGPIVNLILIAFSMMVWWLFPITYFYLEDFVFSNIVIAIFNLLPIYPLDGGRVLLGLISKKIAREKAEQFVYYLSIILSFLVFCLFIITLFFAPNYTIGMISIFLMTSALNFNKKATYEKNYIARNYEKLLNKGSEVKIIALKDDTPIFRLPHYLDPNHYCIFVFFDNKKKVSKVIFEQNLEELLIKYEATTPAFEIT